MLKLLDKYKDKGEYLIKEDSKFSEKCNAPDDKIGVYIVSIANSDLVIYIGRSGHLNKNGEVVVRKTGYGGIKDRLINGHQFGKIARKKSWPLKMKEQSIEQLLVRWYVTYDDAYNDSPVDVEKELLKEYHSIFNCLPKWNYKM